MENAFNDRLARWQGMDSHLHGPTVPAPRGHRSPKKRRILLVGGLEADHRLLELLLTSRNNRLWYDVQFELIHQPQPDQGLANVRSAHPDAVLLDLCRQSSFSLESITALSSAADDAPVIVLTNNPSLVTATEALQHGAEDTLEKQDLTPRHLTSSLLHAIERCRRQKAEQKLRQLSSSQRAAGMVQSALLPKSAPNIDGLSIAGACRQADHVGGDYYDFFQLIDHQFGFVVADVSSHGFTPALIMAGLRRLLRTLAQTTADIGAIVTLANRAIMEDTMGNQFVTLFFASIDTIGHTMRYVAAGHPGYLVSGDGAIRGLVDTHLPLGVCPTQYQTSELIALNEFELLFAITDGFTEAMNSSEQLFGTERAMEVVAGNRRHSPERIIQALSDSVTTFRGHDQPADDCAAVVVKFTG
jgi:serine phosphatase RsbU (regulator of sigma subunit)